MTITFPHMGWLYIPVKALFDDLNVPIVVPSDQQQNAGNRNPSGPGNGMPAHENQPGQLCAKHREWRGYHSADRQLRSCRFGYYGVVEQEILRDQGYDVDIIILMLPPRSAEFVNRIGRITGRSPCLRV